MLTHDQKDALQTLNGIPAYTEVINREGGGYARYSDQRRYVAIITNTPGRTWKEVVSSTTGVRPEIYIVCTGKFHDHSHAILGSIMADMRKHGSVHPPIIASLNVIDTLHNESQKKAVVAESKPVEEDLGDVIHSFDSICKRAIRAKASDIHFQINEENQLSRILYRQNGSIVLASELSRERALNLVRAAYNSLADQDSRKDNFNQFEFQNARIPRTYNEGRVILRFASLPVSPDSLDVVLRILPIGMKDERILGFDELGYSSWHKDQIERAFARSQGITIIAGTTGSGKSTTLKHALERLALDRPDSIIRTIEEPVEYEIRKTRQTPVVRNKEGEAAESPFAKAIKAAMRGDPDVLMIGEIRDEQTADLAVLAVRSGHQAMATIHAESALNIIDRMHGLKVDREDLASPGLLSALVYQRLVPVMCEHCRIPMRDAARHFAGSDEGREKTINRLFTLLEGKTSNQIYMRNPTGCPHCGHTGKSSRTVCVEVIRPTMDMLQAFREGNTLEALKLWRSAIKPGEPENYNGRTAFEHALFKMFKGQICPSDIEHGFNWLDEENALEWMESSGLKRTL